MAFESLADKLQNVFKNLRGKGRLTEADVKAALKEVKMALLEADVSFKVVKQFISSVQERAIGQDVLESLTPGQMVIKIVNEELVKLMGSETTEIALKPQNEITVIMMIGLQGAGKTTTTAKLAGKFKAKGRKPLLAACDVYRPAAIKQLQVNGEKVGVPVFTMGDNQNPVNIAKAAVEHARKEGMNLVFLDTAGRLQIDESMMDELVNIKEAVEVDQTILVVDAMTGQDAVNVAGSFNDKIGVDGVILTKLDGDTRGGAALSIRAVTGKPILYVGMGEKLSDLEQFYPDRMASRILGMGDILSLIEKAESQVDEEKAKELDTYKQNEADFEKEKEKWYEDVVFSEDAPDISNYKEYYESIDAANAEVLYKQVVEQTLTDEQMDDYVKTYSSMKPKEAAAIFDTMTDNLQLVADILSNMDTQSRGDILGKMNSDTAAKVTEIMEPSE